MLIFMLVTDRITGISNWREKGFIKLSLRSQLVKVGRAWAEHSSSPPGGQEAEEGGRREEGKGERVCLN